MKNVKKMTMIGVLTAIAIVLSYIESFIPSIGIPGFKLGLANIVILLVIYELGIKEAIFVDLVRVYIAALLRGTIFQIGFAMSLSGAVLSLLVMILAKLAFKKFSIIGVSIFGAIFHSAGQIIVAAIFLYTTSAFYYLPVLILISLGTGILTGIIAKRIIDSKVIERQKATWNNKNEDQK